MLRKINPRNKTNTIKLPLINVHSRHFTLEVIRYAEVNSNHAASRKYKTDRNSIRDWRRKREKIEKLIKDTSSGAKRKRLDGGGKRVTGEEIEENLLEWIFDSRDKGLRVSRKLIMFKA